MRQGGEELVFRAVGRLRFLSRMLLTHEQLTELFVGAVERERITQAAFQALRGEAVLVQVVRRPRLHQFDGDLFVPLPGQRNYRNRLSLRANLLQDFDTVRAGKVVVEQDTVEGPWREHRHRSRTIAALIDDRVEARLAQQPLHRQSVDLVVVYEKDAEGE